MVPETDNMDLGRCRSSGLAERPVHGLASEGGSPEKCAGEGRDGEGYEVQAIPSTCGIVNLVERLQDEFHAVDGCLMTRLSGGTLRSLERFQSPPCDHNAVSVDPENGNGASGPEENVVQRDIGEGAGVEEDGGNSSALVGDPAVGTSNKGQTEEGGFLCTKHSRITAGCVLQTSMHTILQVEGDVIYSKGDEAGEESEVTVVRSSKLTTVTGVEDEIVSFDRFKDCNQSEFAILSSSSLTIDSSSINTSSKVIDEFCCSSVPVDDNVTSINSGTKGIDETDGNSSELVQNADNKDGYKVSMVPCIMSDHLVQVITKPSMDVLVERSGEKEKEADALTYSKERDISSCPEERVTIHQVHSLNELCQASSIEREFCDLGQDLLGAEASNCTSKELTCLQSSYPINVSDDCPSCLHSVSGGKLNTTAVSISSTCCGTTVDCCMQAGNGEEGELKSGTVPVVRRRNPTRAASLRGNQCLTKPESLVKSRSSATKGRHAVNIYALLSCETLKRVTKKRCRSWKRARLSVWGELGNLLELFQHNDVLSQSKNKGSKKRKSSGQGRRLTDQRAYTSRRSRAKHTVSTTHAISSVEMNQQLAFAANSRTSVHTDPNSCSQSSDLPAIQGLSNGVIGVESISETGDCNGLLSSQYGDLDNQDMSHGPHAQHGEKDPESSVTQEASVENTASDCHGVQSQVGQGSLLEVADGRLLSEAGTSPDSIVLHPTADVENVTNEDATPTSHELSSKVEIVGQNVFDSGSPEQENLHAGALVFSQVHKSVLLQNTQQYRYAKKGNRGGKVNGKKEGKIEENGCLSSDNSFEGTSNGPCTNGSCSLLKSEKPSRSRARQRKMNGSCRGKVVNRRSTVKASEDIQKCDSSPLEHSSLGITELACCQGSSMSEDCLENHALSAMGTQTASSKFLVPENLSSISIGKGPKLHGGNKSRARKSKLTESSAAQYRKHNADTPKDTTKNSMSRRKAKQKMVCDQVAITEECQVHDASHAEGGCLSHLLSGTEKNLTLSKPDEPDKVNMSDQLRDVAESDSVNEHASKHKLSSLIASVNDDSATKGSSHSFEGQILPKRLAWVRCDDCYKWRSIPAELADVIDETNCRWTCKDNSDKSFADCTIPQEKTNAQINEELEISGASCEEDSFPESNRKGSERKQAGINASTTDVAAGQQSSWVRVKNNIFLHRTRKTQTIDEIMVCQCKPPPDGSLGCGDQCLNRMLNIECVPGTCPCGNLCSNQQFQNRKYTKFKWFRCGKKGFGLQLLEDVSQGQFLIEYVGEVLDMVAYEARQREYACRGQKHFYFMTLNCNEVIDACAKGNLGRFINHSCEPNCRTEKWMVNGEVCIGLFAMCDIKKGEEVTFDYNYVRVFGAAAKKCVCGSAECRGYIGGDPLNAEIIVQGDSDEEYPEPIMILEDGKQEFNVDGIITESTDAADLLHGISAGCAGKASKISDAPNAQSDDTLRRCLSDYQPLEILSLASKTKIASDPFLDDNKCTHNTLDNDPHTSRSPPHTKSSRSTSSVKKKSCISKKYVMQKGKKSSAVPPLTQSAVCRTSHFEGVEEKLNELLDAEGGISKRRDATKGYLKLLFLTAASGDNVKSESCQSTRDLSLILDALLKTKSRKVLMDIIHKNGLQMLHNIMKQNRKNFNRIPILRKLLKVLEFLAVREVLTPEHINNIPFHAGVESFKESIIKLARHTDLQVQQMAKNFRNKWLLRTIRKVHLSDRENGWLNSKRVNSNWFSPMVLKRSHIQGVRDTNAICISRTDSISSPSNGTEAAPSEIGSFSSELASTSVSSIDVNPTAVAKSRKRKSRWDQPSDAPSLGSEISIEERTAEGSPKAMRFTVIQTESDFQCTSQFEKETISSSDRTICKTSTSPQGIEEVPPGFGPPNNGQAQIVSDSSVICAEVVAGQPQERYCPQLAVSYGVPLTLVEQLGTADVEARDYRHHQSWAIAPGVPFHPFPPLPLLPRGAMNPVPGHSTKLVDSRAETRPTDSSPRHIDSSATDVSVDRPLMAPENGAVTQQLSEKMSLSPNVFGKRYSRPDRWKNHRYGKFGPPWPRERNGCKYRNGTRNGMSNVDEGSIQKKMGRGFCFSEGGESENVSSTFSELPRQVQ